MSTRGKVIQSGFAGIAAITLLPSADVMAGTVDYTRQDKKLKLRFLIYKLSLLQFQPLFVF